MTPVATTADPDGSSQNGAPQNPPNTPIFDYLLGEEVLDKVLDWSLGTGEFANSLKLEQLRVSSHLETTCMCIN